jgi:non-specific serine/threonine protein kinase
VTAFSSTARYSFGHFELQPGERRLLASGTPVGITPRAFDLLVALVERNGHLVTKEDLLAQIWPGVIVEENSLHAQISTLRKVLGADAITTVAGAGYRFEPSVTRLAPPPEAHAATSSRHNLPRALTSFIGREQQITELKSLLRQTRLLTLSGSGGCGKTRLALELATQVFDTYEDGVWLVELAALADEQLVPQTVAEVLGLKERTGAAFTDTLLGHLASKHLLLVLDNAEHLLVGCATLVQTLLQRCVRLTVLVTSRERLGIMGELTYRVPSLSVPDPDQTHASEALEEYESARLFIERARLQQPHFAPTAQSAPAIAAICAHLDGIPLAVELAAARVRSLSVEEVNQRLDQRFRLLTDSSRTALARHRTLRSMLDWSYDLLSDEEKAVFCRASVFAGGFTLEAAERVLSEDVASESAMVDLLTSLSDKSLLQAEERAGMTRYRQLETVRQYGRDRLRESKDESSWQRRHLDYFVAFAEAAEEVGRSHDMQAGVERLEAEHENLRAALATASKHEGDRLAGLRLAGAMYLFWRYTGYWRSEGRAWLSRFLAAVPAGTADPARAKALNAAGMLANGQGDSKSARPLLEECVALRRRMGDRRRLAEAVSNLGVAFHNVGEWAAARALLEESLAINRELEDPGGIARALHALAWAMFGEGNDKAARVLAEESLDIARKVGGQTLNGGLIVMATALLQDDNPEGAARLCREVLGMRNVIHTIVFSALVIVAFTECALGKWLQASVIWGYTERLRLDMGSPHSSRDRQRHERSVASARAALGDDAAFDQAWRRGAAMTTEEVVEFALRPGDT